MIFIALLAISILFHELGHFLVAKCFGLHVSKFCLFYDFGHPLFTTGKRFSTEYCLGWLPIGGYIKFDDNEVGNQDAVSFWNVQPWKRLIVSFSGVATNLLVAYICLFAWARVYVMPQDNYSNTFVMIKAGEITKGRINDCLHFFIDENLTKGHESSGSIDQTRVAEKQEKRSLKSEHQEIGQRRNTISQDKSRIGKDLLWRLSGINIILLIFNLLPVPPLDGGQGLIAICELVSGRRMNERHRALITAAGLILLFIIFLLDVCYTFLHLDIIF